MLALSIGVPQAVFGILHLSIEAEPRLRYNWLIYLPWAVHVRATNESHYRNDKQND